jgi:hypothetical protein
VRRRHRYGRRTGPPLRPVPGRRWYELRQRAIRYALLQLGRPWVLPFPTGLSDLLTAAAAKAPQPVAEGICAANLKWTIVVLRDGRRSRPWRADVAQLVAHHLAKVRVAGSNPVIRSRVQSHQPQRWSGRVVRQRPAKPCTRVRFPSPPPSFVGAVSSAGERFPDTEEVAGSIPVPRTSSCAVQRQFFRPESDRVNCM